ncbi:diguanylate cyclase [Halomonas sp. M4R5S39]|uniref:sensor domain-containing diguanylate cyclase n=1 Tax=Halomonas kalidii TaxID=3043293 RepID=UPI0024A93231|nr:diguanylate cyclase [Halomonas kalidii]MDI5984538.1 diguanylate cyclase [Halomonas kalidii]
MFRPLRSLQGRILSAFVVGWLAMLVVMVLVAFFVARDSLRETISETLLFETRLTALGLDDYLLTRQRALSGVAERLEGTRPTSTSVASLISAERGLRALFDSVAVVSPQGAVLGRWEAPGVVPSLELAELPVLAEVTATRRPRIGEPRAEGVPGRPVIRLAVPLFEADGDLGGVLTGAVMPREEGLLAGMSRLQVATGGYLAIASPGGTILHHPNERLLLRSLPVERNPILADAIAGFEGVVEAPTVAAEPALQSFILSPEAGWLVGYVVPLAAAYAPVKRLWISLLGVAMALTLLAGLVGAVLLRSAFRPLKRVVAQVDAIEQGQRHALSEAGPHELKAIARAFNRLYIGMLDANRVASERKAYLDAALTSSPVGLYLVDARGRLTFVNPALERITGWSSQALLNGDWAQMLPEAARERSRAHWQRLVRSRNGFQYQIEIHTSSGGSRWVEVQGSPVRTEEQTLGYIGSVVDITERHRREQQSHWESEHDPLTGCLNRRGFEARLMAATGQRHRQGEMPLSLMMMDLDHFKPVNDSAGHAAGDEMLRSIGELLIETVRDSDSVARLGGDEFAILLPACPLMRARDVAERLREAIGRLDFQAGQHRFRVTMSIGIAMLGEADRSLPAFLQRVDQACYRAKRLGRNRVVVHDGDRGVASPES